MRRRLQAYLREEILMNKQQFMAELKQLLGDLPATERDEALNYYEDYFADAGEENEASIIEELGSPEKVAFTIKAGLNDSEGLEGEFTEAGFKGYEYENKDEIVNTFSDKGDRGFSNATLRRNNFILTVIVVILLSPFIIGALGAIFGVAVGILGATFGIICAIAATGIACIVTGAVLLVVGIASVVLHPMGALTLGGISLVLIGIGSLVIGIGTKIVVRCVPVIGRAIVKLFKKTVNLINRKRGIA